MEMSQQNNRIEWIDLCKFLAISLMIAGHIGLPGAVSRFIHIFHMPVFFVVSGITYDISTSKPFKTYLLKLVKTILVPYFLFAIVTYLIYLLIPYYRNLNFIGPLEFLKELFTHDSSISIFDGFGVIQWFLTCIFFVKLLAWLASYFSKKITSNNRFAVLIAAIVFAIIAFLLDYLNCPNYLGISSAMLGTTFFLLGALAREKMLVKRYSIPAWWLVLCVIILGIVWKFNGSTNMRIPQYNNIFLYLLGAIAGSILLIIISQKVERLNIKLSIIYKMVLYLGGNTIIILGLNRQIQALTQYLAHCVFGGGWKYTPQSSAINNNICF